MSNKEGFNTFINFKAAAPSETAEFWEKVIFLN